MLLNTLDRLSGVEGAGFEEATAAYGRSIELLHGNDGPEQVAQVLGELGTSHAYAVPPAALHGRGPGSALGKLGADVSRDASGAWRIDRVLPGESSDPLARSPLAAPGGQRLDRT